VEFHPTHCIKAEIALFHFKQENGQVIWLIGIGGEGFWQIGILESPSQIHKTQLMAKWVKKVFFITYRLME
jgi:hypothetical protein